MRVGDKQADALAPMRPAHVDVTQSAEVAQRYAAVTIDPVLTDPESITVLGISGGLALTRALQATSGVRPPSAQCGRRWL